MLQDGQCAPRGSSLSAPALSLGPRQLVQRRSPLHSEKPGPHAGEAALDRVALRDIELARQRLGLSGKRSVAMAVSTRYGQRPAEPVAVGAAVDLGGERRRPLARALGQLGRGQVEMTRALALGEGDGLEDALAHHLARLARQPIVAFNNQDFCGKARFSQGKLRPSGLPCR